MKNAASDSELRTDIKVVGREPFESESGRPSDLIYSVDLIIEQEESLANYLIESGFAEKLNVNIKTYMLYSFFQPFQLDCYYFLIMN
jgi:hypothetical protein